MQKMVRTAAIAGSALATMSLLYAQRGAGDWMTIGNDGQRSSWVRNDPKISIETMRKPGFQLVWKVKLKNEARQLNSLTPPALFDFFIGHRGFRSLGFFGGSSNNVVGLDIDLARTEWEKSFGAPSAAGATIPCPGGMTSSVARPAAPGYPPPAGRGFGRGNPAKSGVGEPLEGAVTLRQTPPSAPPPPPPAAAPGRRTAPPPNPFARGPQYVHAITADGKFHSLYVSNGEEPNPPLDFLPANAHAVGLFVFDNTAYVATVNGCGGVESGIWALHIPTKKVTHWKAPANVAGTMGFAVGPDGAIYVAAGPELVALEPGTLAVRATYNAGKQFTSSPVVFEFKNRDLIAAATADGRLHLLDAAALSGPRPAISAAFSSPDFATGALASWQDSEGTRWLLAPAGGAIAAGAGFSVNGAATNGAIAAFRVVEESGALALKPAWVSRDLVSPLRPAIVNGVAFALSSGEYRTTEGLTAALRAQRSSKAVLYALDPADRQRVVEQRRDDRLVCPQRRPRSGRRPRLCRRPRRHAVRLRLLHGALTDAEDPRVGQVTGLPAGVR